MKTKLIIISFFLILVSGCTKNIAPVAPDIENKPNRLFTSSFESNGNASMDGWISPGPPIVKFSINVPQGGGNFSIFLKARILGAYVSKNIQALTDLHNYRLTFWSKSTEDPGSLAIYKLNGNSKTLIKIQFIEENNWTKYTIDFELNASSGENIQILLGGSDFASPQGYTYFDLIDLQNID